MKTFSMSEAVAEPFRLAFKRPLMTTAWGLVLVLPVLIALLGMASFMAEAVGDLEMEARKAPVGIVSGDAAPAADLPEAPAVVLPEDAAPAVWLTPTGDQDAPPPFDMAAMMRFQMLNALSNLVQLAGVLLVTTAMARAVFAGRRGDAAAFLRIGRDEFHVAVIGIGAFVVALIAMVILFAVGFGAAFGLSQVANPWRWLIGIGLFVAAVAAFAMFWGRVALLPPTAVLRGEFALEEGWRLGRGQTWKLAGMMLVLGVMSLAVMLSALLVVAVLIALGMGVTTLVGPIDEGAIQAWFNRAASNRWPLIGVCVAVLIAFSWFNGLLQLLFTAPYAYVVKALAAEPAPISTDAPAASE